VSFFTGFALFITRICVDNQARPQRNKRQYTNYIIGGR